MYEFFFGRAYCFQGVPAFTHSADINVLPALDAWFRYSDKKREKTKYSKGAFLLRDGSWGAPGTQVQPADIGNRYQVCGGGPGVGNPRPAETELSTELTHPQPLPRSPNGSRAQEGTLLISLLLPVWELCLEALSLLLPITYPDRGLLHGS